MGKQDSVKTVINQIIKNVPNELKKNAPQYLAGAGVGFGAGVVLMQADKKNAEDKAYKKGYTDASEIYEKKFRLQTEAFLKKEKSYKKNKEELDKLILEYEEVIEQLEETVNKTEAELNELRFLTNMRIELLGLKAMK
ncbi:hypothetical protein ACTNEQ_06450 [Blautia obeum]|uniref:hypothetical protein n=1 Tax=Blautia obeum TaxID=40520 RepID=UPI003F8AB7E8